MAGGNKKKKKPAANPARGFATTSIASKPKPEKSVDTSNDVSDTNSATTAPTSAEPEVVQLEPSSKPLDSRELHELSPDELEARLEQSDLQSQVEQYGPKTRKECARQVARLGTDRRVLRSQAELLLVKDWLPDELMQQVMDLVDEETLSASMSEAQRGPLKAPSEDAILARVWQLYSILADLDIGPDRLRQILHFVLSSPPAEESSSNTWGLSEAFDWLALHCEPGELLDYEAVKLKQVFYGETGSEQDAYKSDSGPSPPDSESTQRLPNVSNAMHEQSLPLGHAGHDIEVSDVESDLDPDEMLSTYLRTKARLFERNPDFVRDNTLSKSGKQLKAGAGKPMQQPSPGELKLQQRLKVLESDILFDKRTADFEWSQRQNELLRDQAERKRLQVDSDGPAASANTTAPSPPGSTTGSISVSNEAELLGRQLLEENDGDESGLLGGMFDVPMERTSTPDKQSQDLSGQVIRNFGKLVGMSPRRILEDACRSRDSGAKLHFKMISPTTYSCRHSVSVSWSKDQDPVDGSYMPDLSVRSAPRSTTIMMQKIATPEPLQSEGFAATVALFLLFSSSPKEEKAALRLPPAFRDLWQELLEARREKTDAADRETLKMLRAIVKEETIEDEEEDVILTAGFRSRIKASNGTNTPTGADKLVTKPGLESQEFKDLWQRKASTPAYQHMLTNRKTLPMFHFKEVALTAVRNHQVTILCGETGCGKSTQMPSFLLEDALSHGRHCKIYCTEPRRISAISLAQRVSEELGEPKGAVGTSRSLIGYAIRLEFQAVTSTRLIYATVGIVLRMLESAKGLDEVTHLVIDEIHERSIDTDFLLIVLQSLLLRRPDLKVILMSATVDAERFSRYLNNAPIVTVPGRTFPVQARFLEDAIELTGHTNEDSSHSARRDDGDNDDDEMDIDPADSSTATQQLSGYSSKTVRTLKEYDEYKIDYNLMVKLLENVAYHQELSKYSKAILIFLPGIAEIRQLNDMLGGHPSFSQGWLVYPLHSSFSSEDQQAAFQIPPQGLRKIVLATNIAETGITIPDVTCVIDTGKHKEMRFDERRQMSRLIQSFISRANAKQRRGRAGRVQEGMCFHLFTKHRHDEIMAEQQTPEMLRLSLQDLVMRVKICKLGDIEQALSAALDPPSLKNIRRAIDALIEVNALTTGEELTPLGTQLAKLPLDAQLGKLILLGSTFGCLDFALTTAAILSSKTPFVAPMNAKKQADSVRLGFKRGDSDLLTAYNAYTTWRRVCTTPGASELQFCRKNFLSPQNLANIEDLKSQLLSSLAEAGFVTLAPAERTALSRVRQSGRNRTFVAVPTAQNQADANDLLINSVTAWSFYPKVLTRDGKGWRNIANNQSISLHPTSVNKGASTLDAKHLSFYSIMQSSSRFTNAQETSPVSEMALVLLAGDAVFHMYAGVIVVDGNRLRFKVRDWRTMIVLKTLRAKMKDVLAKAFRSPGRVLSARQMQWMDIFAGMFDKVVGKGR